MKQFVKKAPIRRSRKTPSNKEEKQKNETQGEAEPTEVPLSPPLMTITDELFTLPSSNSLVFKGREDDQNSITSSNKPLPGLPNSRSSPEIKSKLSADMRQLAMSSHASSSHPSSPQAHSQSAFYTKPASSASNASENWTSPEDAEGEYIRKTYAHFDASGIRGDGVIDGKEWTRERGARAAWEASESTTSIESIHQSHLAPPSTNNGHDSSRARAAVRSSSPLVKRSRHEVEQDSALLQAPDMIVPSEYMTPNSNLAVNDSFGQSTSSLGSHSVESTNDDTKRGQKVATESEEKLEEERRELMKNVDR